MYPRNSTTGISEFLSSQPLLPIALPLQGSLTAFEVQNRFLGSALYVTSHAHYMRCAGSLQQRLILVITVAANGAVGVIGGRKGGLNAGEDNDEISDADVRTSSAFKIEMAHAFLGDDGRIIQIFFPRFSPVFQHSSLSSVCTGLYIFTGALNSLF